ncbi:MAG: YhcG family protein [Bacteroidetes bacterium]|nr:YhcG family protein [Bacteroidota bacterium]
MKQFSELNTIEPLYYQIRDVLMAARSRTYRAVNFIMVETYWLIGKMIVEHEQDGKPRAEYGKQVLSFLSEKLTSEFGEGFNQTNLKYMRLVYQAFPIRHALRDELTWTHYRVLSKVSNKEARAFYRDEAVANQWSTRQLERQVYSFYYERLLSSQQKQELSADTNASEEPDSPESFIKDPYVLEFLNLPHPQKFSEKNLESALISKLQSFLLELGSGFAFVARQKRLATENKSFYIDLVFYNIHLKCYVLIDLKTGELEHSDIGQMDMYVRYYEEKMRGAEDNPTLGIILCAEKDEAIVKYSILKESEQMFASKYMLYLPSEEELIRELKREVAEMRLENRLTQDESHKEDS